MRINFKSLWHSSWYWVILSFFFLCLLLLLILIRNQITSTPKLIIFAITILAGLITVLQSILNWKQSENQTIAANAQQIERTINLLRFFVDIIGTYPKCEPEYLPYTGPTSKDFDMLQPLVDANDEAFKKASDLKIVNFLNQLELFASWLSLYSDTKIVNFDYLAKTAHTFIELTNDFFDVICYFRFSNSMILYPSIVDIYQRLERCIVCDSLIHAIDMEKNGFNRTFTHYDVYYNEKIGISLSWKRKTYIPIIARNKNNKGISGWQFSFSHKKESEAEIALEGYALDCAENGANCQLIHVADYPSFTPVITNSSGTVFISYDFFGNRPSRDSKDIIYIKTISNVDGEPLTDELKIIIEVQDNAMFIEKAEEGDNNRIVFHAY